MHRVGVIRLINKGGCKNFLETISLEPRETLNYSSMETDKKEISRSVHPS